jgi:hypothetical protein
MQERRILKWDKGGKEQNHALFSAYVKITTILPHPLHSIVINTFTALISVAAI